MTLRTRLLLSALLLSATVITAVAFLVRSAWQDAEESRFAHEFSTATKELQNEIKGAAHRVQRSLAPICAHDPIVDSALVGLASHTLDSRLLSVRARVPELQKSLGLDELLLITGDGKILAGTSEREETAAALLAVAASELSKTPRFRGSITPPGFEGACLKREGDQWVALVGSIFLAPLLSDFGKRHGLSLSLDAAKRPRPGALERTIQLPALDQRAVVVSRDRLPLVEAVKNLDQLIMGAAGITLGGAFLFALWLSRGLAQPVMDFAERTREAVSGTVQELPLGGGPELEQAARAFNETLEALRELRQRLILTERIAARREVARQIAHEIKNPLSPIRTSIETLRKLKDREHPEFDSYFEETTSTVLNEVGRIANLVNSFSDYARLPTPNRTHFDLRRLTEKLVNFHRSLGANLALEMEDISEISADKDQISQVLTNLIKNAIEATSEISHPEIMVEVMNRKNSNGKWIEISVSDNGPGVAEPMLERLFEPYATTKKEGTGLGLPISHRIAVEHGGDLTYTNSTANGACFVLLLPTFGPPTLTPDA